MSFSIFWNKLINNQDNHLYEIVIRYACFLLFGILSHGWSSRIYFSRCIGRFLCRHYRCRWRFSDDPDFDQPISNRTTCRDWDRLTLCCHFQVLWFDGTCKKAQHRMANCALACTRQYSCVFCNALGTRKLFKQFKSL